VVRMSKTSPTFSEPSMADNFLNASKFITFHSRPCQTSPVCLKNRTCRPQSDTPDSRQLQTFGPGVSNAPSMQCRRPDDAAFPPNKLGAASKPKSNSWRQGAWPKTSDICPCEGVARIRRSRHGYRTFRTIISRGSSLSSGRVFNIPGLRNP
jgi:hypothetical protein